MELRATSYVNAVGTLDSKDLSSTWGLGGLVGLVAAHYANSLRTVPGAGSIPVFALGVLSLSVPVKNSVCVCLDEGL